MHSMRENSGKRLYTAPRLTMHGTLEDITKQEYIKTLGASDGYMLSIQGVIIGPIGGVS